LILLTDKEVRDFTGYSRPSAQIRWLRRQGWRFTVNALGRPVIAVAEFNRRMVGGPHSTQRQEPDWTAINAGQAVKDDGPSAHA
jgi:hypothetical protein